MGARSDWRELDGQIFSGQLLDANTVHLLSFAVPADAAEGATYARLRFCSQMRYLSFVGDAPDGEVEDYMVVIVPEPAALALLALGGLGLIRGRR